MVEVVERGVDWTIFTVVFALCRYRHELLLGVSHA